MALNLSTPQPITDIKPRIVVFGVGGAGGNAVNNMIKSNLEGVEFIVGNTDAQALDNSDAGRKIQLGINITNGLGAGARPEIGCAAAKETMDDIMQHINGANMLFITAGMGGGTGTGAAPVIAEAARKAGILTVGVVTKPFHFEGSQRMKIADNGIEELQQHVDTLIIIPNQNLFRIANEKTTFADAFKMADDVLYSGVRGVTDLMIMPGLINLDFADIHTVMGEMGKAMMGTGEAEGESRAITAAESAISNPLLEDVTMKGARGVLINITGGGDMTLFEVDEAANRIREEVDQNANIIFGSTFDENLDGKMRVSVVATGIDGEISTASRPFTRPIMTKPLAKNKIDVEDNNDKIQPNDVSNIAHDYLLSETEDSINILANDINPIEPVFDGILPLDNQADDINSGKLKIDTMPNFLTNPDNSDNKKPVETTLTAPRNSFIPPTPSRPDGDNEMKIDIDPFIEADLANAGKIIKKSKIKKNLLQRVSGMLGNGDTAQNHAAEVNISATFQSQIPNETNVDRNDNQAKLSSVSDNNSNSLSVEEELLDIPAFLRRQAN